MTARAVGTVDATDVSTKKRVLLIGYHVDKIEANSEFAFYDDDGLGNLAQLDPVFRISGSGHSYLTGMTIPFKDGMVVHRTAGNTARMIVYYG